MTDPIALDSATARLGLPLLFAGQIQKEVFVNQALAVLDGIVHCVVEGVLPAPPAEAADGMAWLVATPATGAWAQQAGTIALRQAGQWLHVAPRDGMQLLHRARGQIVRRIAGTWRQPDTPAAPAGGAVMDAEARQAIAAIVAALQQLAILPR